MAKNVITAGPLGSRRRRWPRVAITVIVAIALVMVGIIAGGKLESATQATTKPTSTETSGPFLLSIGGSSSLGTQPTGIRSRNGHPTNDGYADDLARVEVRNNVQFQVQHDGCGGMTAQSMLEINNGGHCNSPGTPQLTRAIDFLQQNRDRSGVVVIDIGFNDVRSCLVHVPVDEACMSRGLTLVQDDLPKVLQQLEAAATAATTTFVGLEYSDPFLAHYLEAGDGITAAAASLTDMNRFNAILAQIYQSAGVRVADVPSFFRLNDNTPVVLPNVGTIPENVRQACLLTWMCKPAPFGPDDHPNNAGYMEIADAIMDQLPGSWHDYPPK